MGEIDAAIMEAVGSLAILAKNPGFVDEHEVRLGVVLPDPNHEKHNQVDWTEIITIATGVSMIEMSEISPKPYEVGSIPKLMNFDDWTEISAKF